MTAEALRGGFDGKPLVDPRTGRQDWADASVSDVRLDPGTRRALGVPTFRLTAAGRAPLYAKRLAAAGMSIGSDELNPQYDAGHVSRFFGRYGADPADSRREFYLRAYEVG